MPNKPRNFFSDSVHHIYNRGVEKRKIFYTEQDYIFFLNKILFYQIQTRVKILAYVILPNHWHFMLREPTSKVDDLRGRASISTFMSRLMNSHTKHFNFHRDHSGRIYQGPFRSKMVDSNNYFQRLIRYINLNPLKHGIVKDINDWFYTSHHEYMHKSESRLINDDYLVNFKNYQEDLDFYITEFKNIDDEFNLEGR